MLTFYQAKMALYATFLTNYYGYKSIGVTNSMDRKKIREEYATTLLKKLNIQIKVINAHKIPKNGQYLLASNHRSVIDPLIVEIALMKSELFGLWIAKKELYNSFFFGLFVRKAGTVLLDREKSQMGDFFKDIKTHVKNGDSIFIFPEGTRNKGSEELGEFKEGSKIIAIKNRLDILPVHIKNDANDILMASLQDEKKLRVIEIEIGDIISYRDKSLSLKDAYKKQFSIK